MTQPALRACTPSLSQGIAADDAKDAAPVAKPRDIGQCELADGPLGSKEHMSNRNHHKDLWTPVQERLRLFDAMPDDAFTVTEATEILQVSERTLRRRIAENKRQVTKEPRIVVSGSRGGIARKEIDILSRKLVRRLLEAQGLCSRRKHPLNQKNCFIHVKPCDGRAEIICMGCRNEQSKLYKRRKREICRQSTTRLETASVVLS